MVEFRTEYYTPMERQYHERIELEPSRPSASIEKPIVPINRLGQTVPEGTRTGGNILQNVQAAIRRGAGNIQIVFETPVEAGMGGRPKAYGKEVREALREVSNANEALITSFELPTSLSNLSGWDMQRNVVDEEKRQRDLQEVKDTIRFAAEAAEGGGIDVLSWEFNRPVAQAKWLEKDKVAKTAFETQVKNEKEKITINFVNKRSGQLVNIPKVPVFIKKKEGKFEKIDSLTGRPEMWYYQDFVDYTEHLSKKGEKVSVHEVFKENFLQNQRQIAESEVISYRNLLREADIHLKELETIPGTEEDKKQKRDYYQDLKKKGMLGIEAQKRNILDLNDQIQNLIPMEQELLNRTAGSFAEAGITAMQTQQQMGPKHIKRDLYVGPELGWPQFYGSHPKEFVNVIMSARKKMQNQLVGQGYSSEVAQQEAQRHIKGVLDTSHLGMWLQNFHPEMEWNKRLKKFNKWYKEQINWLAEENKKHQVIGAVQAVDSQGPAHGHLPAGQGIFPVVEAVDVLQKKGDFTGYVISEGHEEEKFGEGRILLKTWEAFNAPIGSTGYTQTAPQPQRWTDVKQAYFGRTYSPMFMFGAYAPSNEFKLWSEIPLE